MSRRKNNTRPVSRSRRNVTVGTLIASRGVVTIAICTGAVMWGYALINLATRA